MRPLPASVALLSTLVVLSTAQSSVPVKFSTSVYHVCTVRGRPSSVTLALEIMKDHNFDFTVNVITRNGTAMRGSDYDAAEVITATIVRRRRSVTISIPIVTGGDVVELPEYFTVELQLPMETKQKGVYTVSPATARIEITDVAIGTFSPKNYTVREGEVAHLMIVLDRPSMQDTIFNVATMNLTATTFDDYFRQNYNVTVPAGEMEATTTVVTTRNAKIEAEEQFKAIVRPLVKCDLEDGENTSTAYITIIDCTVGVKFRSAMYTVGEGDGSVTVTVEASKDHADFDFVIKVVPQDATAETLSDLHEQEVKVTFPAGKTTVEASIGINDDLIAECPEIFHLVLQIPENATGNGVVAIAPITTEIKIIDNDGVNITFKASANYIVREGNNIELVVEVQGESAKDIMVTVMFTSITAESNDYRDSSGNVTIPAYAREIKIPVEALRDTDCDGTEFIKASLSLIQQPPVKVNIVSATAYIAIVDATVAVQFQETRVTVEEDELETLAVTFMASADHEFDFVVNVKIMDGTAERGSDYEADEVIPVTFHAGQNSVNFSIRIIDNDIAECPEQINLLLEVPDNATYMGVVAKEDYTAVINITDTWDAVSISFSQMTYTVPESEEVMLKITLDKAPLEDIILTVNTMDITAQSSIDYEQQCFNVTIQAGMTMHTVPVQTRDNTETNDNTEFKLILDLPSNCGSARLVDDTASVIICDTRNVIQLRFKEALYRVGEGLDSNALIGVVAAGWHPGEVFSISVIPKDGTAKNGTDYSETVFPLSCPDVPCTYYHNVIIINDDMQEFPENFTLKLEMPPDAECVFKGSPDTATVEIIDVVQVTIRPVPTVTEGRHSHAVITLDVVRDCDKDSFNLTLVAKDGNATNNSDYSGTRFPVTIQPGEDRVTVRVPIVDDHFFEDPEEFTVELEIPPESAALHVISSSPNPVPVKIEDDDDRVVYVRFEKSEYSVAEEDTTVEITVLTDRPVSRSFSVSLRFEHNSTQGSDYRRVSRVDFRAGQTSATYTVTIFDDTVPEEAEVFFMSLLSNDRDVYTQSLDTAKVTIEESDLDTAVPVSFSKANYDVTEGEKSVDITLQALKNHTFSFSVTVSTRDGTASSSSDYSRKRSSVYFRAKVNEVTFTVTIHDERLVESTEVFYIDLEIPSAAANRGVIKGKVALARVTILNDDVAIPVRFNQTTYSVVEGERSVSITLVVADHVFSFSVRVSTRDGTASSPSDYSRRRSSVYFRAGVNQVTFTVTIRDEGLVEPDEEFYIELEIPSAAANRGVVKASPDNATVIIRDDDEVNAVPVMFNQTTYSVVEGEKSISITLVAAADHAFSFSVSVSTRDRTASSPSDYSRRSRSSVSFPAGVNQVTFTVTIRDEGLVESDEEFYIELEIPPSAAASSSVVKASPDNATVIIQDDDASKAVSVKFSQTIYHVTEKVKYTTITLQALVNHTFSFSVSVSTRDGTATNADYGRVSRSVRFPARVNEVTFRVFIYDDKQVENTEDFYIDLEIPSSSADNSVIKDPHSPATTRVTITDGTNGVRFIASTYKGTEGDSILITLVANPITTCLRKFTVYVTSQDGSATSGDDYTAVERLVNFDFEETEKSFPVNTIDDSLYEKTENVFLDLEIPPEAVLEGVYKESPASTKIEITDNDDCVIPVSFGSPTYTVGEKQRSLRGTLETPAYYPRSFTVYVVPHSTNATATGGTDYRSARIPVTFSTARHGRPFTVIPFTVTIRDDFILEFGEYFFLDLEISTAPPNCNVTKASPDRAIVHIKDDERVIPVEFSSSNYTVGENRRFFTGTLKTPGYHARAFTVYVVTNGTNANATGGTDYRSAKIPVTFSAGRKEHTFTVIIYDDIIFESDEYFFLDLEIPAAAAAYGVRKGSPDRAKVYIEDDEYEIPVRFSNATYEVTEGVGVTYLRITLKVLEDRTFSFKVRVSTRDGSAAADKDYRTLDTDITISPRQNSYIFNVQINPDEEPEFPEEFYIDLRIAPKAESRGVRLASSDTATVVINDDDMVLLTLDPDTEVQEEDVGTVNLTITASKPAEFSYEVMINTMAGTAEANVDFKPGPYNVTFQIGETTATVSVSILDDMKIEEDAEESFLCTLNISKELVSKGFQVDPSAANTRITIRDNDVHGGWSSWLELTSCSVSCGGGVKVLVRECNNPVPAHGGNDCEGKPFKVEDCNNCPCDASWSSWVPGACSAPCGQNGTAVATRKCSGPSECCSGEGKRTEVCSSPPCQGRTQ